MPSPEPGCVLLAKPNVRFVNDPAKMLSVVLVLQRGQSVVRACASSGCAWRLWAARLSQEEAGPLGVHPLPRVLELAASKAADFATV